MSQAFRLDEDFKTSYLKFLDDLNNDPYNFQDITEQYAAERSLPQDWIEHTKVGLSIMLRDDDTISPEEAMAVIDMASRSTLLDVIPEGFDDPITYDFVALMENEAVLQANQRTLDENDRILAENQRILDSGSSAELTDLQPLKPFLS